METTESLCTPNSKEPTTRVHEVWSVATVSWHGKGNDPTYNVEPCFETFPFIQFGDAERRAIAAAGRELHTLRQKWINPPEWVRPERLAFKAHVDGPWGHLVESPDTFGFGMATYERFVPVDEVAEKAIRKRTLTELYNHPPSCRGSCLPSVSFLPGQNQKAKGNKAFWKRGAEERI